MPKPTEGETEKDFVERCIPMVLEEGTATDGEQAAAVCHSMFRQHHEGKRVSQKSGSRHNANDRALLNRSHKAATGIASDLIELGAEIEQAQADTADAADNTLKALSSTDDELRVGNHIVLFGGRDLTAFGQVGQMRPIFKNADGTAGEFFSKDTQLESPYTAIGRLPVDWEHGLSEIERDDVLGYVDWPTKKIDDQGVFVERVLNRHNQYVKWLEELIRAGLVGTSSEAIHGRSRANGKGEITHWPLMRDTLTVQPAEPRMKSENIIAALKALGLYSGLPGQAAPDGAPAAAIPVPVSDTQPRALGLVESESPMPDPITAPVMDAKAFGDLTMAVQSLTTELTAVKAKLNAPALPIAGAAISGVPDDAKPFKSMGEQTFQIIKAALHPQYADPRLEKYNQVRIAAMKATGMYEGGLAEGGAFLQTEFSNQLMERTYATGQVLGRVQAQPIAANANSYSALLIKETSRATGSRYGGLRVYRTGEGGTITSSRPEFDRKEFRPYKLAALCYQTDELVQDAVALEGHVRRLFPLEAAFVMENELFRGTGAGQTTGILNATATVSISKETGQAAATIVTENISKMWARLWGASRANAVWYYNQDIEPVLDSLFIPAGTSGLTPQHIITYGQNGDMRIKGRSAVPVEYCSSLGTVGDLILADFTQYLGVTKGEMRTDSSIHVQFTTDEMALRFIWRWAADPLWRTALVPANGTNNLSPFVTLATRA